MRAGVNTIWMRGLDAGGEMPDLIYPYFESPQDLTERMRLLDNKIAELKKEGVNGRASG